ncbi:6-phosphogluconolactonase [Mesorhizobium sp. L-8-3]|uniref:6-phosphogluconolactonase n=1 Tax=Mesorhizobium sp. L-8-3 TaxID=2744522 RepID=UPI001938BFBF|nr:6-phosphogluconolactonase [Mesorhizobium sp. L-8-3]BCH26665.1 6-phosphogluconolactonase [Mesorhizobium sp. L-8-3]
MDGTSAPALAWNTFGSSAELAAALAGRVGDALRDAVARRGTGFIAVSGGTTPALFFRTLSNEELDWQKVIVTLVDERFVDRSSPRANAGLVKANLLQNKAATARFEDLYRAAPDLDAAAGTADAALRALPWPLDVAVLGLGGDGHTASFFPGAANLAALLDPASTSVVLPTHASDGEPRLTLPLARLVEAPMVALHIEGAEKRKVLESALADGSTLPIRSALDGAANPVQLFWAP